MKTQHFTLIVLSTLTIFFASLFFMGCSASEETEEEVTEEEQPVQKEPPPKPAARRDTVTLMAKDTLQVQVIRLPEARQTQPQNQPAQPEVVAPTSTTITVFTVQIGAFHSSQYAEDAHRKATQQFTEPVFKEYDSVKGFHRVTVGNFKTKPEALEFRQTCVKKGYKDAWVIEAERTVSR